MKTMIVKQLKIAVLALMLVGGFSKIQANEVVPEVHAENILRNCLFESYYKDKKTWASYVDELITHIKANYAYFKEKFGAQVDHFINELHAIKGSKNIRQIEAVLTKYSDFVSASLTAEIQRSKARIVSLLSMRLR